MRSLGVAVALLLCWATAGGAQVIRGTLTAAGSSTPLADAVVTVVDSISVVLSETRSLDNGTFVLDAMGVARVRFFVRKVGVEPTASDLLTLPSDRDTIHVEVSAPLAGVTLATVKVVAAPRVMSTFNEDQLRKARQSGWRVIDPERIARVRGSAQTLGDLVRRLPLAGIRTPNGPTGCFLYTRSARCLTLIVDGQVLGPNAFVSPYDVFFVALVTPAQAMTIYGARAADGALYIATRRDGMGPRPD